MDIDVFRMYVKNYRTTTEVAELFEDAITFAQDAGRDAVGTSDVLIAYINSRYSGSLKPRLVKVGLTSTVLTACSSAMSWRLGTVRSRLAIERMFELALMLAEQKVVGTRSQPMLVAEEVVYAAIAAGSRVTDTVIVDALQTSVFSILCELEAPEDLVLRFFPAANVEDMELAIDSVKSTLAVRD